MNNLIEKLQPIFVNFLIKLKHWNEGTELPIATVENGEQEKPIRDILLTEETAKARSFKIGKGMTKVEPLAITDNKSFYGELLNNGRCIDMLDINMGYFGKQALLIEGTLLTAAGAFFSLGSQNLRDPSALFWTGITCLVIGIPLFIIGLRTHLQGFNMRSTVFNRETGLVTFTIDKYKTFSIPYQEVELYTGKLSSGKGVQHQVAYLAPKRYPKEIWWQKLYSTNFNFKNDYDKRVMWTEVQQFMDKTKPIPKAFYKNWQQAFNDNKLTAEVFAELVHPDIQSQADLNSCFPFYNDLNEEYIDKEFW